MSDRIGCEYSEPTDAELDEYCWNVDLDHSTIIVTKGCSAGISTHVIICSDRAGRVNVGTIGHIDAARLSRELNQMNPLFGSPKEIHGYMFHPMEDRRYCLVFDEPQIPKSGGEEWRERHRKGRTGVAKSRRVAKKRRSRR